MTAAGRFSYSSTALTVTIRGPVFAPNCGYNEVEMKTLTVSVRNISMRMEIVLVYADFFYFY